MVANRKLHDGENEYVTIERIEPVFVGRNHIDPDLWVGVAMFDENPLRLAIRNTRENRAKFLEAGYVPADIFKRTVTPVQITVLTAWDAGQGWLVGEVLPAVETVHSDQERQAAWKADVSLFGQYIRTGDQELTFSRIGETIVWTKDSEGRYIRTCNSVRMVFESANPPQPVTTDAETVRALLASYGVAIVGDVRICTGARRRSANGVSWAVQVAKGAKLPPELWARFEANAYRNADLLVFELKKE